MLKCISTENKKVNKGLVLKKDYGIILAFLAVIPFILGLHTEFISSNAE